MRSTLTARFVEVFMTRLLQLMVKPGGEALPRGGEMESNSCWCAGLSPVIGVLTAISIPPWSWIRPVERK